MAEEKPAAVELPSPAPDSSPEQETEKVEDSMPPAVASPQSRTGGSFHTARSSSGGSVHRDAVLTKLESEKKEKLIRAWEESEKTKAENKAQKKMSSISSWENTKKAALEAELRRLEERLEKKKAEYAEKMKNKVAMVHRKAEEKRAMVVAKRGEDMLKVEEDAARYRASGHVPKSSIGWFS